MSLFTEQEALKLLRAAKVFYWDEPDPDEPKTHFCLNMNDTFAWALAYGPYVADDQLISVAELFYRYGNAGLNYWCTIHPNKEERILSSEFEDVQRGIDFVKNEEAERLGGLSSDERAYHKMTYTLGERK